MLYLTTASNCESIRQVFKASIWLSPLQEITVAQQPANYTRFLFNSIPDEEDANLKTIIKVKNERRR